MHYKGEWRTPSNASLITLKALTYRPTGGIVAAPTTSLPEHPGGVSNWDYRFCWLRDATITLLALMNAGYYEEADAWRAWLLRAAAGNPDQLQIMYGLAGERRLTEWEVPWLPGYNGAKPVRIGNAASQQLQLDVYGEVMDALHQARCGGLGNKEAGWRLQRALIGQLEHIWDQPDQGIWELRGEPQHYTYSKVMAWVAVDRAIRSAREFCMEGPVAHWESLRERIHQDICQHAFDTGLGSFVQYYGSRQLDASLLLLPIVGFLPASDPRIRGRSPPSSVIWSRTGSFSDTTRRKARMGFPKGKEFSWPAASGWLTTTSSWERRDEARELFERLLAVRNDLGLLAEEYTLQSKRFAGNFPQAFSHVALVNTALNLSRSTDPTR